MLEIADVVSATGCPFVGAGIIGPPPKAGTANTKFYAAGPQAADFARLNDYGLIVRVLDGPLTAAAALKMSYAGITKGFTALGATMMLAATRAGSAEALKAELAESRPDLLGYLSGNAGHVFQGLSLGGGAGGDFRLRRRGSPRTRNARSGRAAL